MKKVFSFIAILMTLLFTGCFSNNSNDESTIKKSVRADGNYITIYYDNPTWFASPNNINIHYNAGSGWTAAPGVKMTKNSDQYGQWGGWASITISNTSSLTFCFNNGTSWDNNSGKDYKITSPGVYTVKNGLVTKQGITIDLYVPGNTIYPAYDVAGVPVTLYKNNAVYATSTITYTTSHGVYATFKNVLPGDYKAVINSEINSTYQGRVLLSGENPFTITNTMTYFSGNANFTVTPVVSVQADAYFIYNGTTSSSYDLEGMEVKLSKNGVYLESQPIHVTTTHGIYATFRNLGIGNYTYTLSTEKNNQLYSSTNSFKVDANSISKSFTTPVTVTAANQGWLSVSFSVNGDSQSVLLESKLIGQKLKLYKNNTYVKDLDITNYSYFINEAYAGEHNLTTGTYKVVLDATVNNVRYTGEASAVIDGTDVNEKTAYMTVTSTPVNSITIYYDNPTWFAAPTNINIHYNTGSGWTASPGTAMTKMTDYYGTWGGWAKATINASTLTFCFNNGTTWDNNSGKDYKVTAAGTYTVKNGVVTKVQ